MKKMSEWNGILADYARPSHSKSFAQLIITAGLFAFFILCSHLIYRVNSLMTVPFSVTAGFFIVKLFIIQHDCGHRSYFSSRRICDITGRLVSIFTLTPYGFWRRDHDKHHATSGHLDKRGHGDIDTMTVREYLEASLKKRILYRIYRNPAVLLGVGPIFQFFIRYRIPLVQGSRNRLKNAAGIMLHNVSLFVFFTFLCFFIGTLSVAVVWIPAFITAATVGVWLFFVQHNFDDTYWEREAVWNFTDASLLGCSYYRLPAFIHWLTGNIGYHHIHHLSSRIPNYNLARAFREIPELSRAKSLGFMESLKCMHLALWCEQRRRMVSFRETS